MRYECAVWIGMEIKDGRNEEERGKKMRKIPRWTNKWTSAWLRGVPSHQPPIPTPTPTPGLSLTRKLDQPLEQEWERLSFPCAEARTQC